jgi:hypothetical protein
MRTRFQNTKKYHGNVLQDGVHRVKITEVSDDLASNNGPWIDRTPQLKFKFESNGSFISQWVNLLGYMTASDFTGTPPENIVFKQHYGNGEMIATVNGRRIENPVKTQTCHDIIERIADCAGAPIDWVPSQLLGLELMITVKNNKVVRTDRIGISGPIVPVF